MADDLVLFDGGPGAAAWTANAADGCSAELNPDGTALRLDFQLGGNGSWLIARRDIDATLPEHYVAVVRLRGHGPRCEFQLKLVDPSGANVWWWRRKSFDLPATPQSITLRKASLEFAWGPASGGEPRTIRAVELALSGNVEGAGSLWIEAVTIEAREPAAALPVIAAVTASSSAAGHQPELALDADSDAVWQPDPSDARPWIQVDLERRCEWGGLVVDYQTNQEAPEAQLLSSDDGSTWTAVATTPRTPGARQWLRTADGEGRYVRVLFPSGAAPIASLRVVPLELAVSPSRYITKLATKQRRGLYPRHVLGEQAYWAVASADGAAHKSLLSDDGAIEVDAESFSLEPFVWLDGQLLTWADVERRRSLPDGHLPIPSVEWHATDLRLTITAFAVGSADASTLVARYEVTNSGNVPRAVRLFVVVRPFQVNPAWQSLNLVGGVAPIARLALTSDGVRVNDSLSILPVTRFSTHGAAPSAAASQSLEQGQVPRQQQVDDPIGFAEAVMAFDLDLSAGAGEVVALAVPLTDSAPQPPAGLDSAQAAQWVDDRLREVTDHWRARLAVVPVRLPPGAAAFEDSLRASIAWILVNRDGPRIQPGPRCYRRSWIRDGTLTGTAIAEMGFASEAREFLRWYAPYQLDDGRVPCAVDHNGIDPVAEHDSHGQLIWGIVEIFRLTGDRAFLEELWPHIGRAVDAIEALRAQRTTAAYRNTVCFGLLPESISHEGYSSRPVHSYWDDFFAVRGLADAAEAAALLGDNALAQRAAILRDDMRRDLHASIVGSMAEHHINFVPGAAELGDFDPTSTAIALDPCAEGFRLPPAALAQTFQRYWEEFEARRDGSAPAEAYTPYEVRTAAALVMLGHKDRAYQLLDWLIGDQRPTEWREWPEIAWRDQRAPRFFGDLPHGWVASSFVRAVRRMLAYERAEDGALVLAAGVPESWVREAPGIEVRDLPTHCGPLSFRMHTDGSDFVRVTLGGDLLWPTAGIVIHSPFSAALRSATIDGQPTAVAGTTVAVRSPAREILLRY